MGRRLAWLGLVLCVGLLAGSVAAQTPCSISTFEDSVEGWRAGENAGGVSRVATSLNGPGIPFVGAGMLEWTSENLDVLTDTYRTVARVFDPALDLRETPVLRFAVNTYGRPDIAERGFEARARVFTDGVIACGTYAGGSIPGTVYEETRTIAKNAWTEIELDLSDFEGVGAVDRIEIAVRARQLRVSGWGGRHQLDAVEARATPTDAEPGAESPQVGLAFPNPARSQATLTVRLDRLQRIRVSVVDALGRTVLVPFDAPLTAGEQRIEIDTSGLASGSYAVRVETLDGLLAVRPLTVMR